MGRSPLDWAGRRRPYGRRRHSHPWVEEACPSTPYWLLDPPYRELDRQQARTWHPGDLDGIGPRVKAVPMPRGGVRYLFRCLLCDTWRTYLFNPMPFAFFCRRCMGLRYKSQYIGRRVAASAQRLAEARAALQRSTLADELRRQQHDAVRRAQRAASQRLRRQQATWRGRHTRLDHAEHEYRARQDEAWQREIIQMSAWCDHRQQLAAKLAARVAARATGNSGGGQGTDVTALAGLLASLTA